MARHRQGGPEGLDVYLEEIGREPLLSRQEERRLARRARVEADRAARQRLVTANLRFVVSVAKQYRHRGVPLEDLINEGNLGLLAAAERYDETRGVRFVTYASWWVRQAMLRAIAEAAGGGPPPLPSRRPGADGAGGSETRPVRTVSLDAPVGGEGAPLRELLPDAGAEDPAEPLERGALREAVDRGLAFLPEREERVLRMYFGLDGAEAAPLGEIARELGVSRERARQLKDRAITRLRQGPLAPVLAGFGGRPGRRLGLTSADS